LSSGNGSVTAGALLKIARRPNKSCSLGMLVLGSEASETGEVGVVPLIEEMVSASKNSVSDSPSLMIATRLGLLLVTLMSSKLSRLSKPPVGGGVSGHDSSGGGVIGRSIASSVSAD
jgi:hypothetical protein